MKPFNHTSSSSFFRMACRVDELGVPLAVVEKIMRGYSEYSSYANEIKNHLKKRSIKVSARRKHLGDVVKAPFKTVEAQILYSIAIGVERILEKHYQKKSGETYVILSKSAMQLYEMSNAQISVPATGTTTVKGENKK